MLVLDEATSNVDTASDALIQETVRAAFADCTVLTIAHRLHSILESDRVLVLEGGKVKEFDMPERLLQVGVSRVVGWLTVIAREDVWSCCGCGNCRGVGCCAYEHLLQCLPSLMALSQAPAIEVYSFPWCVCHLVSVCLCVCGVVACCAVAAAQMLSLSRTG